MSFKLTILGSSGALPAYGRFPTSQHVSLHHHHFLIDCGEGTQLQLARFNISIHKINRIFISHLHGDHYLGLTGLLFSMHLQRRESDLHIYSFKGLDEILLAQLKHSRSVLHFKIIFHVLTEGKAEVILDDETFSVETIPLDHKIKTSGFLFREKSKSFNIDKSKLSAAITVQHIALLKKGLDILDEAGKVLYRNSDFTLPPKPPLSYAYCSDTQPSEIVAQQIHGVDLLYHEATFMEDEVGKARETKHSTASEAAQTAKSGKVKKLVIGHFSARYKDLNLLLKEAINIFPETYLAIEGQSFEL
ncbi:MAG TPA: ribonuclease Z [Cyclobacteriaceae bacterium]|nr:ribonuclease Z [Cyclobacteriaceae bacterium]